MTAYHHYPVRPRLTDPRGTRQPASGLADRQNPHYSRFQGATTEARGLLDTQEHNRNTLANGPRKSKIPKVTN
jgi:hypothetical protein